MKEYEKLRKKIGSIVAKTHSSEKLCFIYWILRKTGVHKLGHIIFDWYEYKRPTSEMLSVRELYKEQSDKIDQVRSMLADEYSCEVYDKVLQYKMTKDRKYLKGIVQENNEYFPDDIIKLSQDETFIDCGAFTGDTVEEFIERSENNYCKIVAFEPDNHNFNILKNKNHKLTTLINAGVWSKNTTLYFSGTGTADSTILNNGEIAIEVKAIDKCEECKEATFIKMDIEGSEMEALSGAVDTIRRNKPKLAICIYHKPQDMYEIPLYIKQICPEYKIYIRQHFYANADTLLYAVHE